MAGAARRPAREVQGRSRAAALVQVGLTGGIAAGKSEVLRCLADAGCHTLDLDRVAHAVMAPGGSAFAPVVDEFGPGILDASGAIDRAELGRIVFSDAGARRRLGALVHPRIRDQERRRAREVEGEAGAVLVVDAALLVETGSHLRFDRLVVVHATPDLQLERLRARDGLDQAEARRRLDAQMPVSEKRRYGHRVVDTSGDLAATRRAARRLGAELLDLARTLPDPLPLPPQRVAACLSAGPTDGTPSPAAFLESAVARGDPELADLAAALRPGSPSPWYASEGADPSAALGFAAPVAIWALARRGEDAERIAGAAFSVGRLFGLDDAATASLVLMSLVAAAGGARGLAAVRDADIEAWSARAERWCGRRVAPPEPLRAALAHPEDAAAARDDVAGNRGGVIAAGLVALAGGRPDREPAAAARRLALALR